MSRLRFDHLFAVLEAPARPFARCLAHYWRRGHNTTRLFTGLMGFMVVGPLNLILWLVGIPVGADADEHYWLVFLPALVLIMAACEIFISRLARGIGPSEKPSISDWLVFWGLPAAGPVLFLFSSA